MAITYGKDSLLDGLKKPSQSEIDAAQLAAKRNQLQNQYGGNFSNWTPGTSNAYNYNKPTGGGGGNVTPPTQPAYNPYADYMAALERQRAEEQAARDRAAEAAKQQQQQQYDANALKLNQTADKSQQEAYLNYMLSKRDMGQQLSAQGLSGGAAESTWANLLNGYGNSRNNTEQNRLGNLADLQQTLQNNLAGIEQQRLSGEQASISNYYTNVANMAAQNAQRQLSMQQGSGGGSQGTDYSKYLASNYYKTYQDATANGYTDADAQGMAKQGISQYIYSLLASGQINQDQANGMMKNFGF